MEHKNFSKEKIAALFCSPAFWLGVLSVVILCTLFSIAYTAVRNPYGMHQAGMRSRRAPMRADQIREYMTFGFINRAFGLPEEYLREQLQITDPRYPKISLAEWAGESGRNSQELQKQTVAAVAAYFAGPDASPSGGVQ